MCYLSEMYVSGTRLAVMVSRLSVACWWNTFMETSSMLWVSPSTTFANSWTVFITTGLPLQLKKLRLSIRATMALAASQYRLSPHPVLQLSPAKASALPSEITPHQTPKETAHLLAEHCTFKTILCPALPLQTQMIKRPSSEVVKVQRYSRKPAQGR